MPESRSSPRALSPAWLGGLLAVILLGAGLRLHGLAAESIWLDEATSILLARMDLPSLIRTTAQDIHPPVYYALLHLWLPLGEGEFAVRALSAFAGILAIPFLFQLGRSLYDEQVGLLAALLLAVSPLHVWYSQEARMYALVTLLTLGGSYWLWQATQRGRAADWLAYALSMSLALYTHYHAVFVILAVNAFALLRWALWPAPRPSLRRWLLAQAAIALLFLPWLPVLLDQIATGGGYWIAEAIGHPGPRVLVETWIDYGIGNARLWYPVEVRRLGYALFAGASLLAVGAAIGRWRRKPSSRLSQAFLFTFLYLGLSLGAVWLVSQFKPMYARRYLLPFLPPYLLLLAMGVRQIPWARWRAALAAALAALCLLGIGFMAYYPQNDAWRSAVSYVQAHAQPGDVAVFVPQWNHKPFDYYARGALPLYRELPVPLPQDADVQALLAPLARYQRLWLVWTPGHYADPDGRVRAYLDGRFRRELRGDFAGAGQISLYDLGAAP